MVLDIGPNLLGLLKLIVWGIIGVAVLYVIIHFSPVSR